MSVRIADSCEEGEKLIVRELCSFAKNCRYEEFVVTAPQLRVFPPEVFKAVLRGGDIRILRYAITTLHLDLAPGGEAMQMVGFDHSSLSPVEYYAEMTDRCSAMFVHELLINPCAPRRMCARGLCRDPDALRSIYFARALKLYGAMFPCGCDEMKVVYDACADTRLRRPQLCAVSSVTSEAMSLCRAIGDPRLLAVMVYRGFPMGDDFASIPCRMRQPWTPRSHSIAFPPAFRRHQYNILLAQVYLDMSCLGLSPYMPLEMWLRIMSYTPRTAFGIDYDVRITTTHVAALLESFLPFLWSI